MYVSIKNYTILTSINMLNGEIGQQIFAEKIFRLCFRHFGVEEDAEDATQ